MLTTIQNARPDFGQLLQRQPQPSGNNITPLFGGQTDSIHFGARRDILKDYGVDPNKVEIQFSKPGMKLAVPKRTALIKFVQAWEHARKNSLNGNSSGRYYVTNAHMANGAWGLGTNIELDYNNDILLCGERSATVVAFNEALQKKPLSEFQDDETRAKVKDGMKIDFMALSSGHKEFGEDMAAGSPCSECQSWIATQEYFSPTTQIASVIKDPDKEGHWILRVNEARDFMPFLTKQTPSVTTSGGGVFFLPFDFSDKAKAQLQAQGISEAEFRTTAHTMLNKAWAAYKEEPSEDMSGERYAVTALFPGNKMYTEARFDLNARWQAINPDLTVIAKGVRDGLKANSAKAVTMEKPVEETHPTPQLQALAYYGDSPKPTMQNVGKLAQKQGGNPNALVVVIENNRIQVRTLLDYMTEIYVSGGGTYGGVKRQLDTQA